MVERTNEAASKLHAKRTALPCYGIFGSCFFFYWSMSSPFRTVCFLFAINGFISLLGFLTQIALANHLGKEQYGLFVLYVAMGTYLGTVVRYGRERTVLRDLVHFPDRIQETISSTVGVSFSITAIIAIGFVFYGTVLSNSLSLALFFIVWGNVLGFFDLQPVYDYWRQMGRHSSYIGLGRLVFYGFVWSAVFWAPDQLNLLRAGIGLFLGMGLTIAIQYLEVGFRIGFTWCQSGIATRFRSDFPMMLLSVLDLVYGPALILLLGHFHGKGEVGIYNLAAQFLWGGSFLLQQITRVGNPRIAAIVLSHVSDQQRRRFLVKYMLSLEIFAGVIAFPLIVFPQLLTTWLLKQEYAPAGELFPIFGLAFLFHPLFFVSVQYVLALRLDRPYFFGVVLSTACGLFLGLVLVPVFGISGAAWSYFATIVLAILCNGYVIFFGLRKERQANPME